MHAQAGAKRPLRTASCLLLKALKLLESPIRQEHEFKAPAFAASRPT